MTQRQYRFPFVGSTIRAHISYASLRWPGQAKAGHGISRRMPQVAHLFCMRSSLVGHYKAPLSYRTPSGLPRGGTCFVCDETAADWQAAGRWLQETEGYSGIRWPWPGRAHYVIERLQVGICRHLVYTGSTREEAQGHHGWQPAALAFQGQE